MAKLLTQRASFELMDACLQIHGGAGYMREYFIERAARDARLGPIGGGSDEIMREILGRVLAPVAARDRRRTPRTPVQTLSRNRSGPSSGPMRADRCRMARLASAARRGRSPLAVLGAAGTRPSAAAHAHARASARRCRPLAHRHAHNTQLTPTGHNLELIRAATLCLINRERAAARRASAAREPAPRSAPPRRTPTAWPSATTSNTSAPAARRRSRGMRAAGYISSSRDRL